MDVIHNTIKKIKATISKYGMIDRGDLVIVAVSGGPDSVCLLDTLHSLMDDLGFAIVVAHYNHGLRPPEDESEVRFVRRLADSMDLPFECDRADLFVNGKRSSVEEKARNARYAFLENLMVTCHAQKIAMGHNLNDQAETVIMRLLRGSGTSGLAGIPPIRENRIIRPLIEIKREDIIAYLKARKCSYVTDSSNLFPGYLRNEIRLNVMPGLLKMQPRLIDHLGHTAEILRHDDDHLENEAEDWLEKNAETKNDKTILIPISDFIDLPYSLMSRVSRRVLKKIKKNLRRIDGSHIQAVDNLARSQKPQGSLNLPDGIRVKRVYRALVFTVLSSREVKDFHYILNAPGTFLIEELDRSITLSIIERSRDFVMDDAPHTAYLDAQKLQFPFVVRNFKPGDRFVPLGMAGHKKIKDFFVDLKVPSDTRRYTPILISKETPVWICGYRIDERFKVTPDTKKVLKATVE